MPAFFSLLIGIPPLDWYSNNILYPKEDREQKILLYACRNCDHQVPFPPPKLSFPVWSLVSVFLAENAGA